MAKNTKQINIRIDEETYATLQEIDACTDIDPLGLARHAVKSLAKHWRENRSISSPFVCIPEADYEALTGSKKQSQ